VGGGEKDIRSHIKDIKWDPNKPLHKAQKRSQRGEKLVEGTSSQNDLRKWREKPASSKSSGREKAHTTSRKDPRGKLDIGLKQKIGSTRPRHLDQLYVRIKSVEDIEYNWRDKRRYE